MEAGASIVNDVTGFLTDPGAAQNRQAAKGLVLMAHPRGANNRMPEKPGGRRQKAAERRLKAGRVSLGSPGQKIVLDPGIRFFPFGKMDWWRWDLEV